MVIVVGLGAAGLSCAYYAALRGHHVIAYDAENLGGQFNLASKIPGKESYHDTIRYFEAQLSLLNVEVHRNCRLNFEDLRDVFADAIVFATGVIPRKPDIEGIDHFSVMDYETAILNKASLKNKIAIIGAGGIGFDVAEMLIDEAAASDAVDWYKSWGIDKQYVNRGGLLDEEPGHGGRREVYLLQRKSEKPGKSLARTTGWIHRLTLRRAGVKMMTGVSYEKIDDFGLHIVHEGERQTLAVDHVITCAGQVSENDLYKQLSDIGQPVHIIGGAKKAAELDAETAIREGMVLAYTF
jgi:2,4-dienoyl-CoA reductase (NADPH2)